MIRGAGLAAALLDAPRPRLRSQAASSAALWLAAGPTCSARGGRRGPHADDALALSACAARESLSPQLRRRRSTQRPRRRPPQNRDLTMQNVVGVQMPPGASASSSRRSGSPRTSVEAGPPTILLQGLAINNLVLGKVLAWWKSKFYGAFVLNLRVDSTPSTRRLLDGVAMQFLPLDGSAHDTLVDFHKVTARVDRATTGSSSSAPGPPSRSSRATPASCRASTR